MCEIQVSPAFTQEAKIIPAPECLGASDREGPVAGTSSREVFKSLPHSNRVYCSILFGFQMFAFPTREVWANCSHKLIKCVLRHVDLRTINKPPDTARLQNQSFSQNGTSGEIPKSPQTIYKRSTKSLLRELSYLAPHTHLAGVDM